jgi:glycosyltransferase involved in cell wall biosynthesis
MLFFIRKPTWVRDLTIVKAHDLMSSNAMVWIKQGRGRKGIITMHSTEYGRCGNNFYGGSSQRIMDHERHGTYCADKVITVSQLLKNEIQWIYNVPDWKACVVPNGISYHSFDGWIDPGQIKGKYGIGPVDPTVLFVGRMTSQKGRSARTGDSQCPALLSQCQVHLYC